MYKSGREELGSREGITRGKGKEEVSEEEEEEEEEEGRGGGGMEGLGVLNTAYWHI